MQRNKSAATPQSRTLLADNGRCVAIGGGEVQQ